MHLIYTAITDTTGDRKNGVVRSTDGMLDIRLSDPTSDRIGTNPEQLMAAAWSVSFASTVVKVARETGVNLSSTVKIHTEVDLSSDDGGSEFGVRLFVQLPGLERAIALTVVDKARRICSFSKATQGNVKVVLEVL
jgi:Ohr subfamily peroxiredoxin